MANSKNKKSSSSKTTKKVVKKTTKAVTKAAKKDPKVLIIVLIVVVLIVGLGIGGFFLFQSMNKGNNSETSSHNHSSHTHQLSDTEISINFLELGNKYTGDSTFIKAGDVDILIDAGSRNGSAKTIGDFIDTYCTDGKLEYVIATHAHQDHIAGFVGTNTAPGVFARYQVETIIDFNLTNSTAKVYNDYVAARDAEVAAGAKHYTALDCWNGTNGGQRKFQITEGIELEVLYQKYYEETTGDENDYSVCVMINHGDNHYLFTGDLEKNGEKSLVASNTLPKVQLFKGAHHGSYTANTDELLSVIQPEVVCICCCAGSDEYTSTEANMFPAQAAINRLGKYTEKIYVTTVVSSSEPGYTSMNGNICFHCTNGKDYTVTGSNNNTILKETEWFKAHRTWPTA